MDTAIDEFARRMYGPAAGTMRQLLALQTDGWENSEWPGGRSSPKGIYEASFPPKTVAQMESLFARARQQAKGNSLATARLDYYEPAPTEFFAESELMHMHVMALMVAALIERTLRLNAITKFVSQATGPCVSHYAYPNSHPLRGSRFNRALALSLLVNLPVRKS